MDLKQFLLLVLTLKERKLLQYLSRTVAVSGTRNTWKIISFTVGSCDQTARNHRYTNSKVISIIIAGIQKEGSLDILKYNSALNDHMKYIVPLILNSTHNSCSIT